VEDASMSDHYLLECRCGKTVPVSASQAGGEVRCACGSKVDVPPLRTLRKLPIAEASTLAEGPTWTGRQRLWVLGGVLIVAGIVLGVYTRWNVPPPPDKAVAAELLELNDRVRQEAPKLSLSQAIEKFVAYSNAPLRTFDQILADHKYNEEYQGLLTRNKNWTIVAWGLVGLGFVVIASTHILSATTPRAAPSSKLRKGGHAVRQS
jgi:hypothetical protein